MEGVIRPESGDSIVEGQLRGTINLFLIGTGTKPLKTVAFPLTVGADNSVGAINMSDTCPGDRLRSAELRSPLLIRFVDSDSMPGSI